jgi:hypothetical protein
MLPSCLCCLTEQISHVWEQSSFQSFDFVRDLLSTLSIRLCWPTAYKGATNAYKYWLGLVSWAAAIVAIVRRISAVPVLERTCWALFTRSRNIDS